MVRRKNNIVLNCNQMRFPQSGLYSYCYSLAENVQKKLENDPDLQFSVYIEKKNAGDFKIPIHKYIRRHGLEKLVSPQYIPCRIWHLPFQDANWGINRLIHPGLKKVLTIHDLNMLHEGFDAKVIRKKLRPVQKLIDSADAIICISEFCKKDVTENCDTGNTPIHVILNGISERTEAKLVPSAYKPARPFLYALGYIGVKKNFHVLLPLLENNGLELLITGSQGEPAYIDFILSEAKRLGVEDRLVLTGPVSESVKHWYLSNCLAFMHPSLAEGFGLPVAEAMYYGKPLFLSDKTALPEIGGDVAFYFRNFTPGHLKEVFAAGMKKYDSGNMREQIIQRAGLFDWQQQAARYIAVYRSLL